MKQLGAVGDELFECGVAAGGGQERVRTGDGLGTQPFPQAQWGCVDPLLMSPQGLETLCPSENRPVALSLLEEQLQGVCAVAR